MRVFSKVVLPLICSAVLLGAVSILPLIPVEVSPVVPNPIARSTVSSLFGIFTSPFLCGVRVQATWATFPVMLGLIAIAVLVGWKLGRRLARGSQNR